MTYKILSILSVFLFSFAFTNSEKIKNTPDSKPEISLSNTPENAENADFEEEIAELYQVFASNNTNMPALKVFEKAMKGYEKLEQDGEIANKILTVVDFELSSKKKRMWILDMESKKVLFHTYVSHGKNTGGEFATKFSNTVNSLQSSLGFYVTGETYYGKNGLSLFIDGKEKGFNSNARKRYVVIHGADYADPSFIKRLGRLGRSYGCPAVPNKISKDIIETIKDKSVVYIHKNDKTYTSKSAYINHSGVANNS